MTNTLLSTNQVSCSHFSQSQVATFQFISQHGQLDAAVVLYCRSFVLLRGKQYLLLRRNKPKRMREFNISSAEKFSSAKAYIYKLQINHLYCAVVVAETNCSVQQPMLSVNSLVLNSLQINAKNIGALKRYSTIWRTCSDILLLPNQQSEICMEHVDLYECLWMLNRSWDHKFHKKKV